MSLCPCPSRAPSFPALFPRQLPLSLAPLSLLTLYNVSSRFQPHPLLHLTLPGWFYPGPNILTTPPPVFLNFVSCFPGVHTHNTCISIQSLASIILKPGKMSPKLRGKQEQNLGHRRGWCVEKRQDPERFSSAPRSLLPVHTELHLSLLSSRLVFLAFL